MGQEIHNFGRFWTVLQKLPYEGELLELKGSLVKKFTNGRTESLREMTASEYDACCKALETLSRLDEKRRKLRSRTLKQMQQLGIDTTDWARVNDFCRNPRICGKVFAQLKPEELEALSVKLRAIAQKGGLKSRLREQKVEPDEAVVVVMNGSAALPSC